MRSFLTASLAFSVGSLALSPSASAASRFGLTAEDAFAGAKTAQSLYVYDSGVPGQISGEYARYTIPDLQLQETTAATGDGSPVAFGKKQAPYFTDEVDPTGFGLYAIPSGSGAQPAVQQFSGIPCYASSLATGPSGNFYAVQYCSSEVLEFSSKPVQGGGAKKPIATYSGGNFGGNSPYGPTYAVVDKAGGLYVGDTGGGVTYWAKGSKTAVVAFPAGQGGDVNGMVADDKGDVWSIHGPNPTSVYFANATSCVIDPSGTVVRNELAERFSGGVLAQQFYTGVVDGPYAGSDGLSIAVDSKLRMYAGVGAPNDSVVLDYGAGESCPTDALAIVGAKGADPQVAVDAKKNLYVTDYVDNTISEYAGGSTTLRNQITQQTGLINLLYAAID